MPPRPVGRTAPETLEAWLAELGLPVDERAEREGVTSWDLQLDGRLRAGIRMTVILDPARALLLWVHYAPPINDSFRVSYRQLLHWNDELPFVKFGLSADERIVLASELPAGELSCDTLGRAVCRLLAVCDLTLERARPWLALDSRSPDLVGASRQQQLFERYAADVDELMAGSLDVEGEKPATRD